MWVYGLEEEQDSDDDDDEEESYNDWGGGGGGKMDMVMMRMGMCKKTPITSTKETTATPLNTTTINDKNSSNANPCGI